MNKAKVQSKDYVGIRQYMGNGMTRSCGKCLQHRPPQGGSLVKPIGWICKECADKRDAMKVPA